jgi:hypothetical protein
MAEDLSDSEWEHDAPPVDVEFARQTVRVLRYADITGGSKSIFKFICTVMDQNQNYLKEPLRYWNGKKWIEDPKMAHVYETFLPVILPMAQAMHTAAIELNLIPEHQLEQSKSSIRKLREKVEEVQAIKKAREEREKKGNTKEEKETSKVKDESKGEKEIGQEQKDIQKKRQESKEQNISQGKKAKTKETKTKLVIERPSSITDR